MELRADCQGYSLTRKIFEEKKKDYMTALKWERHKINLIFKPRIDQQLRNNRIRKRDVIWFTSSHLTQTHTFNLHDKTKIRKIFFYLIRKHFPKPSKLSRIFNSNTIKLSYSCTGNLNNIIKGKNTRILKNDAQKSRENNK